MVAYVACAKDMESRIRQTRVLETAFFGGRHVSLTFTVEYAMEKAVEANKCTHAQALNKSHWAVLQVCLQGRRCGCRLLLPPLRRRREGGR